MSDSLPVWIMEPGWEGKAELSAERLLREHKPEPPPGVAELKKQIRVIRESARENIDTLVARLQTTLKEKYPAARVKFAATGAEAVAYITQIAGDARLLATNNSGAVVQELRPGLQRNGFTVTNSYLQEFYARQQRFADYWDLPRLFEKNLNGSFAVTARIDRLPPAETKKYVALLGINAISAEDGRVFFLQHFNNILKDLGQASRVVLVAGLDKIVKTSREAAFQTQCMGVFGLENVLLGLKPEAAAPEHTSPAADGEREVHIILLDNGRRKLLDGILRDLFLCIGCRACNQHCPIRHHFTGADYIWTPRTYLNQFLLDGGEKSLDACLHCEACRLECPLDIDLPYLIWQAKLDYPAHRTPFRHRILGRPEVLAKLGTATAPLANWLVRQNFARVPLEMLAGIDRRTVLPEFHAPTFREQFKKHGG